MSKRLRNLGTTVVAWAAAVLVGGVGVPLIFAVWDPAKPANNSLAVSADIRANWDAIASANGAPSMVADGTFLVWHAGDAASPAHWALSGASAAIARSGTGLGDTVTKVGPYSAKITSGGAATAFLEQDLVATTGFDTSLRLRTVSCGAWLRTSSGSTSKIYIWDGATQTDSAFHAGGSVFSWLTTTHTLNSGATKLAVGTQVAAGTVTTYVSGVTCVMGQIPPPDYMPCPVSYEQETILVQSGNLTTGTDKVRWHPHRAGLIRDVYCEVKTPPTTQSVIVDVNTWDGAALTSMFSTRPTIVATARRGTAQPDTTYARRCFKGMFTGGVTTPAAGEVISFDIDQIGSGTVGADLQCAIRYLTFKRPYEVFLPYNAP